MCSNTSKEYEPVRASLDCVNLFLHWHVGFPMHTGTSQGTEISCFPGIPCLDLTSHAGTDVQFWTRFKFL